jgi:hypothetical protein
MVGRCDVGVGGVVPSGTQVGVDRRGHFQQAVAKLILGLRQGGQRVDAQWQGTRMLSGKGAKREGRASERETASDVQA